MSELGLEAALKKSGAKPNWLIQIDVSTPLLEIFDEKFFGMTNLLTPSSIVYGGALIAALTGAEILGDLDIAVAASEHSSICDNFSNSMKWIQVSGRLSSVRVSGYKKDKAFDESIVKITSFETFYDVSAQIIVGQETEHDLSPFDASLRVTRGVDFSICSMAMDYQGRVFETMRGAWDDCKNKVLRVVRSESNINYGALIERSEKYIKRGYVLDEASKVLIEKSKDKAASMGNERFMFLRDNFPSFVNIIFTACNARIILNDKLFSRACLRSKETDTFIDIMFSYLRNNFGGKKESPRKEDGKVLFDLSDHGFNQNEYEEDKANFESAVFDTIYGVIDQLEKSFT
jgi:hypothetical protein